MAFYPALLILFNLIFTQVTKLNPQYQFYQQEFNFKDGDYSGNDCFIYGIWSKYNPLSIVSQVGSVGLFDSNYYHLHNIVSMSSENLNLIYYDYLEFNSQKIKKILEFINEDDIITRFEISIDALQYENIWYYLGIIEWPAQLKFEIIIIQEDRIRIHEIKQMKQPFKDTNILLKFGGDFVVTNTSQSIPSVKTQTKFSYFPGYIMIQKLSKQLLQFDVDFVDIARNNYEIYGKCYCIMDEKFQIDDSELNKLDKQIYISKNTNCDSFIFQGWFKIIDVISSDDEFTYKFITLSANYENSLSNKNLQPFQMSYFISSNENKILMTTYSYTFPAISIDFKDDPFIQQKEFVITNSITVWHIIFVELQETLLNCSIKFYEAGNIYEYNVQFDVNQFHIIQLKLQYGNLLQSTTNFINMEVKNLILQNCHQNFQQQNCHFSCQECDGPTMYNCLSCFEESQRIYIPEQKVCVCPYNSIDEITCQIYLDLSFQLILGEKQNVVCQLGYFEYQEECFKCPSLIRENLLSCLECLNNPKGWKEQPFCNNDLYFNNQGGTQQQIYSPTPYFFVDGIEVTLCQFCSNTNFSSLEDQYLDYLQQNQIFQSFCQNNDDLYFQCYKCSIPFCIKCHLSIQGLQCIKCYYGYKLNDGKCISKRNVEFSSFCQSPQYMTSKKKCAQCSISYCKYCFEYQPNNLLKSTLYKNFEQFGEGEELKVGCALCDEGFIFNFNKGKCINQKPQIQNCIRSFINQNEKELCTLSEVDDFKIAPEILNCQKYLNNCLQCLLSPDSILKCIICQEGYTSSIINGDCYKNQLMNTKIAIEGDLNLRDGWVQRIQSFMIQFLPNKYLYPKSEFKSFIKGMIVECNQGYRYIGESSCEKYCDDSCLQCETNVNGPYCAKCPLNYYQEPIRDQENGQCSECSQLCQICQSRTQEEIYNQQPTFILDEKNKIFTKKCLKPINNPNIIYNSYTQGARYCFESNCLNQIMYEVRLTFCGGLFVFWQFGIDQGINIKYCNQMGIDTITIVFTFQISSQFCELRFDFTMSNQLKSKIFSLRNTYFLITSVENLYINSPNSFEINYFDKIELNNFVLQFSNSQRFIINNNNTQVDLKLINFAFKLCNITSTLSLFQNEIFGNIQANNFSILESTFINSSILNLEAYKLNGLIIIQKLQILRCFLKDSNLFQFGNNQFNILIQDLIIEECEFYNSSIFMFKDNLRDLSVLQIQNITIQKNIFYHSNFIKNANLIQLSLMNFNFSKNNLISSNLISFNYHLTINNSYILENYFQESITLNLLQTQSFQKASIFITNLYLIQAYFFYIQINQITIIQIYHQSTQKIIKDQIWQIRIFFQSELIPKQKENCIFSTIDDEMALFVISCSQLHIFNANIINVNDQTIFKIYETKNILIQNLLYKNEIQYFTIPIFIDCHSLIQQRNQLFIIIGFFSIEILDVQVIRQFNIDLSFIDISNGRGYQKYQSGRISICNVSFQENLQLSRQQINLMSLLSIHAEIELTINLKNINFIENVVHSQADSTLKNAASLMLIASSVSFVLIENVNSQNNAFTNSTNTFFNVISNQIFINNLTIINHNVLTQELWQKYYDLQFEDKFNQEDLNNLIFQILKISNIAGVCSITLSKFSCQNCNFTNIFAYKSSIFQINTINEGLIKLNQIQIQSVQNNIQMITNSSGCISINAQNSLLNLQITNAIFTNVLNRMAASILTIQSSEMQNQISFLNIQILNCISLINQFLYVRFSPQNINNNILILENLLIQQSEEKWKQYFSNFATLSEIEMAQISGENNAVINIQNCQIIIKEIVTEGLFISPIMRFNNVFKILLFNVYIQDIQLFYPTNIIIVDQDLNIKNVISFQQVYLLRIQIFNTSEVIFKQQHNIYQIKTCKLFKTVSTTNQKFLNISSFQNQFSKLSQKSLSVISINSVQYENQIKFQKIRIQQNFCSFCSDGLINFKVISINFFQIEDFSCSQNQILSYGCLLFQQKEQISTRIKIVNSNFYNNNGSIGVGITAYNSSITIKQCKLFKNIASENGGGLYIALNNNSFLFNQSIIINNEAQEAGGIYLNGKYILNKTNFIMTMLLFNKALNFTNNLKESPTHLSLLINEREMASQVLYHKNQQLNMLKLAPYSVIEQERQHQANYLMLPSGQSIGNYEITMPQISKTLFYIKDIGLYLKNSRNEYLQNLFNSTCIIQFDIISNIKQNKNQIQESNQRVTVYFNQQKNYFDLSSLSIIFDPYDQDNKYLQIHAACKIDQFNQTLNYLINVKSFKCQLGEFYTNKGCQKCIANQGFYSVTYDTNKCSIFDKNKFLEITENKINLQQGFWRPHYLSDQTNYCFKNQNSCKGGWSYGNNLCSIGHSGALCEECDIQNVMGQGKYYKTQQNQECQLCKESIENYVSFILIMIWAICSMILTQNSIQKSYQMSTQLKFKERFNKILFKLNQDLQSILIKMLLNYLWMFSLIFTFNIQFSFQFVYIDQLSNTSYFMVNNLDCYLSNIQSIEFIYLKIFTMLIFILQQSIVIIMGYIIYSIKINQKFKSSMISNTLLILYIFNFPGLIKMQLRNIFRLCSTISNRWISNVNYIQGDVSLLFGSESHLKWMYYFVIPILIFFGYFIPFNLFVLLHFRRKQLDSFKIRSHLCYLYNEYNEHSYFWEIIKLVQKIIMILISTYFETNISIKAYLFGITLLFYQVLTVKFKPYLTSHLNNLDLHTGQICSMSIFLAAVKNTSDKENNQVFSSILQTIILFLCALLCRPFILKIIEIYYKKNKEVFYIIFFILFKKLKLKICLKNLADFISKEKEKDQKVKANYQKLKIHLFSTFRAQMTNRRNFLNQGSISLFNSSRQSRVGENLRLQQFLQLESN
ncbi:unnamed protein product [Paramecium sonneborni]|uniref:Laminin EGF-like domain-containing protein n=1 Tax=Paramecium sonneborni TaxID=65129 RepID=A0A8S1QPJ8_9CILI|nr:unnamed protein product [Paramecium sonneborni]